MKQKKETVRKKTKALVKIKRIKAAGGVVFKEQLKDPTQPLVLLIFRNGFWDLPKGKLEKGESLIECARREVAEEVNSDIPLSLHELPTTYHEYTEEKKTTVRYGKTTYWYVMQFERDQKLTPQLNEGITEVAWVPLEKAKQLVGFENLKTVLDSFEEWFVKFTKT